MGFEFERIYKGTDEFPIGLFSQSIYIDQSHHHIEYELFYLAEGECYFGIEDSKIKIYPGDVIFIPPATNHYVAKTENNKDYHYYAMVFDISVLGKENDPIRKIFESIRISRYLTLPADILKKIRDATELQKNQAFGKELFVKALLFEIIAHTIATKQYVEINKSDINPTRSVSAIDSSLYYIREHYRDNITMEDILQISGYSKSHFIRLFKSTTGMNLTDFINKYRIEKSCLDLIYTNKNITEIATENGFNTVQYFSKTFKTYMKCTPKQYQKNGRSIIVPSTVASIV